MSQPSEDDALIRVGDLARETGLTVRTLHHYEAVGLLQPSARTDSGHRLYGPAEIKRLYRIATLRRLRLSLADIRAAVETARERREADLHQLAADALARATQAKAKPTHRPRARPVPDDGEPVRYPVRAFVLTWTELEQWWTHYDAEHLATELTDEQIEFFLTTAEGTMRFAEKLRTARDRHTTGDELVPARGHLRAL